MKWYEKLKIKLGLIDEFREKNRDINQNWKQYSWEKKYHEYQELLMSVERYRLGLTTVKPTNEAKRLWDKYQNFKKQAGVNNEKAL